jgi:hypothetical protein
LCSISGWRSIHRIETLLRIALSFDQGLERLTSTMQANLGGVRGDSTAMSWVATSSYVLTRPLAFLRL